jgi:uncharacterized protein (DUF1501 family)
MKRRKFLKNIGTLSAAPLLLHGLPVNAFSTASMLPLLNCQGIDDRVLVVIFLKGANDGVNTIIPINQYDDYAAKRPNIKLNNVGSTNGIINLDTSQSIALERQVGIHPVMTAFKSMYEGGKANLIQAVGYPQPNKSHFKATDLWLSGGDGTPANFDLGSGWIGRYMESAYPGVYGVSTPQFPDPLGIQFGDTKPSNAFHNHEKEYLGINLTDQNLSGLYGLLNGLGTAPHAAIASSDYGDELNYIMNVENSTNTYGGRISSVFNTGTNSAVTYPSSSLAGQLKSVARLLKGGIKTKVFLTHKGGFDTHVNQVVGTDTSTGTHANLLKDVFDSIKAFHDDLNSMGLEQRVVTVTFSEFGRKVAQNGSLGTDHGNFAPMFMFGPAVQAGIVGNNIVINNIGSDGVMFEGSTNTQMQFDYRSVFKTLLKDWLGAGQTIIDQSMFGSYNTVNNLIKSTSAVATNCYTNPICYDYVTTSFDGTVGSLRKVIECMPSSGGTAKIAIGDNLPINQGSIMIDKQVSIEPFNNQPVLRSSAQNPMFTVGFGGNLTITGLTMYGNDNTPIIVNNGNLILINCTFKGSDNPDSFIQNSGNMIIQGRVEFLRS